MSFNKENSKENRVIPEEWILPNRKEFIEWINTTFIKYRSDNKIEKVTKGVFKPFKYQQFLRDYMTNNSPYRGILLYQTTGSGKCVEKGTPIIMYNGSIKKVEDIIEDDLLMGDDSTPRRVTSLARGFDKMYEVKQSSGEKYTVNSEHILCLKVNNYPSINYTNKYNIVKWIENNNFNIKKFEDKDESNIFYKDIINNWKTNSNIIEISIKDYLKLSNNKKKQMRGYRVPIDFNEKHVPIDPYMYGYWLGTENNENFNIIEEDLFSSLSIDLGKESNKYILDIYKCNSRKNRLRLLAGLLDSNINISKNITNLMINTNNKRLFNDILYLIRSLGIGLKILNNTSLYIYGKEIEEIPLITPIKKLLGDKYYKLINNNTNYLLSNIKVTYVRYDEYYGFTLDGNFRFIFGDFTVTHNTCTAIEIAENLKTERNIVIMLPASLRNNFIVDGLLFCGNPLYRENPELIKDKYTFISYNANNTITQIKRIGNLDNKVIIIDEVHNLVSKMMNGLRGTSKHGLDIYNYLMNAQNSKIIAMSGTPIINDPFEAAILFNILKGYIEINYFRIIKVSKVYGEKWELDSLENELLNNKLIDYLEINKINKSIEFHLKVMSYEETYRELISFIQNKCYELGVEIRLLEVKKIPLFPVDNEGELFKNTFVKENTQKGDELKNENIFKKRLLGLVSYYKPPDDNYPSVINNDYYRVPMSNYQFQIYEILRAKERLSERGGNLKKKSVKSTFRVFSRQACNFVFPEEVLRPYPDPKFIVSIKKNKNNKNTEINFNKLLELEDKANNGNLHKEYKKRIDSAIKKIVDNGLLYLKPGSEGLDKLSPKMRVMLQNINNSPGLVFVYSNFRTLEGVEIFSKVLEFNGYQKFNPLHPNDDIPKYAIYSGSEEEDEKKETLRIFTSSENKYGKLIKVVLATSAGAEGLDLKNIRQIHIMEPYWNQVRIQQVIGRGVRRNSHIELPPKDRNVEIFRYFSVLSNTDSLLTRDKMSTDEYIEQISIKKQIIINEMLQILKEISIDCFINNSGIKGKYSCFSFGRGAKGFSYYPTISKDLIESSSIKNTKTVQKTLKKGIITEDGMVYLYNPTKKSFHLYHDKNNQNKILNKSIKKKPILIDKNSNEIYDVKVINGSTPNLIGFINKTSKFSKKRVI
jgi:superfamily II DNA or RNA helicase